jgi:hypothetical protein
MTTELAHVGQFQMRISPGMMSAPNLRALTSLTPVTLSALTNAAPKNVAAAAESKRVKPFLIIVNAFPAHDYANWRAAPALAELEPRPGPSG